MTERPGGAPFINNLPQSVLDRAPAIESQGRHGTLHLCGPVADVEEHALMTADVDRLNDDRKGV